MISYQGRCHCCAVQFSFDVPESITEGTRCNCSYCSKINIVHSQRIDPNHFRIDDGLEKINCYLFADKVVEHKFCSVCGVYVFYTGSQCKVNLACVDNIDISSLKIRHYDGESLL